MRRTILLLLCGIFISTVAAAQTPKMGVGAFGGLTIPIIQDDQGSGKIFGFMARFKLGFLSLEPNVAFAKYGEPDPVEGIDLGIDGSKVTSYGVDAVLGGGPGVPGFKPIFVGGIASYKMKNDDTQYDESRIGYSGGLGFLFGFSPKLDLSVRGKLHVIPLDGGGSKKSASVTGGLILNF